MKNIRLVLASLALAITVISCGGKKDGDSASGGGNSLEGTWEVSKAEGMMADMNKGTKYIFEGNKITLSAGIIKTPGTFRTSGDSLIVKFDGGTIEQVYTYSFANDQLVTKVAGTDQVFYMDKK
ncbi:MAG TPA: lipocalin family protein [Bacteroidia bacterium]